MARFRRQAVTLRLLLGLLLVVALPSPGKAQSNADAFNQIVSGELGLNVLSGPNSFALEQQEGVLSVFRAGLDVADFVARATFINPPDEAGIGWDYGFQFRTTGNNEDFRIFAASDGTWNFSIGVEPPRQTVIIPGFDSTPGVANTLDLVVQGSQALFGINGQFLGAVSLPELEPSGDVYASTGFLGELVQPGRIVELTEFLVYDVPGAAEAQAEEQTALTEEPVPPARPVTLLTGVCTEPGEPLQALLEATYPIGERQGLGSAVVAETSFTRVPFLLGDLLAQPHAIAVASSFDAPDDIIACADIGGIPDEIGGFVIALTEQNASGYSGIIYLAGDDELGQTNISIFLAPDQPAAEVAEEPAAETEQDEAGPSAVVEGTPGAVITAADDADIEAGDGGGDEAPASVEATPAA